MLACLGALITGLTIYAIVYVAKLMFGNPAEEILKVQKDELEMKARKMKKGDASDVEDLPVQYNLNV